jgi:hypothetical protein
MCKLIFSPGKTTTLRGNIGRVLVILAAFLLKINVLYSNT